MSWGDGEEEGMKEVEVVFGGWASVGGVCKVRVNAKEGLVRQREDGEVVFVFRPGRLGRSCDHGRRPQLHLRQAQNFLP